MTPSHKKAHAVKVPTTKATKDPSRSPEKPTRPTSSNRVGDLNEGLSYVLKHAAATLKAGLSIELRELNLSAAQHACLELLGRSPGLSSAELARGAFVSRQSMNLVLRGLQERGLVTRPETAPQGRALPTKLTAKGRSTLNSANVVARNVEKLMITAVPEKRRAKFRKDLAACAEALARD